METKKLILIGAGSRGRGYTNIAKKMGTFELVAIAEPLKERRDYIGDLHGVPENMRFESWEPLLALGKIADAAIISTQDRDHFAPAMEAINQGYNLLLEKPVSPTLSECEEIERAANAKGVTVLVCHVLRYTPFFRALKKLIDDGLIGDIVNIEHTEGIGNLHFSHSFVRGNWCNSERSAFSLLAKSCHDIDILEWLIGKNCISAQSYGSLTYFKRENAPEGATERCFDGCPHLDTCTYSAKKLYIERDDGGWFRGAATKLHRTPTDEDVMHSLATTNYGRCVFLTDNDVCDHQTVNMLFEDGITVSFTMSAFNLGGRRIRIMGTKGELIGEMGNPEITYNDTVNIKRNKINVAEAVATDSITQGHGGGDSGIMHSLYDMLCGKADAADLSNISVSVKSHRTTFAAEKSRLEGRTVYLDEYKSNKQ